jgi:hypothetical protein
MQGWLCVHADKLILQHKMHCLAADNKITVFHKGHTVEMYVGIPFVPFVWVLKSSVSVFHKIEFQMPSAMTLLTICMNIFYILQWGKTNVQYRALETGLLKDSSQITSEQSLHHFN